MINNVEKFHQLMEYLFATIYNAFSHQDFGAHMYFAILFCIYIATFITVIVIKLLKCHKV